MLSERIKNLIRNSRIFVAIINEEYLFEREQKMEEVRYAKAVGKKMIAFVDKTINLEKELPEAEFDEIIEFDIDELRKNPKMYEERIKKAVEKI